MKIAKAVRDAVEVAKHEIDDRMMAESMNQWFDRQRDIGKAEQLARATVQAASEVVGPILCKVLGHKLEDHSCGSMVESGGFALYCTRCGAHHSGYMTS